MISVDDAYKKVIDKHTELPIEKIPLSEAYGRVLRENWFLDRDQPPYDRVTMDGIAIAADGIQLHQAMEIESIAAAGDEQVNLLNKAKCIEVMTGSILPINCDTVIRYEDLTQMDNKFVINNAFRKNQNIHWRGQDKAEGDLVVSAGIRLSASEIGVGASIGKSSVLVSELPKTIIISTGNELVDIDQKPKKHQIRKSNVFQIQASLMRFGIKAQIAHLDDNFKEIFENLKLYLNQYDLIILSGGVSMGKFDFVPEALEKLKVEKIFHKVAQRPGKPLWFGKHENGVTVFALPGNPVSTFLCTHFYIFDWIRASSSEKYEEPKFAILQSDVIFKPDLSYFVEVKLDYNEFGQILAYPKKGNGSGDLVNLSSADAFMKLPVGKEVYKKNGLYQIIEF